MVKNSLHQYFERFTAAVEQTPELSILRTMVYMADADVIIYVGTSDADSYIGWRPVEMLSRFDFSSIEAAFDVKIHESVVDYYNSYWFVDVVGFYGEHQILLDAVLPSQGLDWFVNSWLAFMDDFIYATDYIPIGIEGDGFRIVVNNDTGAILLEDFERRTMEQIAGSLCELIDGLRLLR